jgi:hypothetical protein
MHNHVLNDYLYCTGGSTGIPYLVGQEDHFGTERFGEQKQKKSDRISCSLTSPVCGHALATGVQ